MGKATRVKDRPLAEIAAPPREQLDTGAYDQDYVLHSETGLKALAYVNRGIERDGRMFKLAHFDRLHKAGIWTQDQYLAGCWYRDTYDRGGYERPSSSDLYRVDGSVSSIEMAYSSKQQARDMWRHARMALPRDMIGYVDGLLIRNRWPKMQHRERARSLGKMQAALDVLARFLRFERY